MLLIFTFLISRYQAWTASVYAGVCASGELHNRSFSFLQWSSRLTDNIVSMPGRTISSSNLTTSTGSPTRSLNSFHQVNRTAFAECSFTHFDLNYINKLGPDVCRNLDGDDVIGVIVFQRLTFAH